MVVRREASGGTRSGAGRDGRDASLGLRQTCAKLGTSFRGHLGHRLGVPGADAPHLPDLVASSGSARRPPDRPPGSCPAY